MDKMFMYVNINYEEIVEDFELFAKLGHWTLI